MWSCNYKHCGGGGLPQIHTICPESQYLLLSFKVMLSTFHGTASVLNLDTTTALCCSVTLALKSAVHPVWNFNSWAGGGKTSLSHCLNCIDNLSVFMFIWTYSILRFKSFFYEWPSSQSIWLVLHVPLTFPVYFHTYVWKYSRIISTSYYCAEF